MRAFALAAGFLTIVPVPVSGEPDDRTFGRAALLFPVIGLLLGIVLAIADIAARQLWDGAVASAIVLAVALLLTGAIHFDGFLDTCDGLFLWRADRRLEAMRDSRVGGFGVAGGLALYAIKLTALATMPAAIRPFALILMPALGRSALTLALVAAPYARASGAGSAFKRGTRRHHAVVALAIAFVAGAGVGALGLIAVALSALLIGALCWFITRRLGGMTGDTYGFVCECVEALTLLVFASAIGASATWWSAP